MTDSFFPSTIESFTFVSRITLKSQTGYYYALYTDSQGKKYFAKGYEGNSYSSKRALLEKEIHFARFVKDQSLEFAVPVVYTLRWKYGLIALFPFVQGKELSRYSKRFKKSIIPKALQYIESLQSTRIDDYAIPRRPGWLLVCLFPYFFIKACIAFPATVLLLLLNAATSVKGFFYLFEERAVHIAHRDFNPHNILKSKSNVILLDWCYVAKTVKDYDLLYLLIIHWDDSTVKELYASVLQSQYHRALGLLIATIILTDGSISQRTQKCVISFLLHLLELRRVSLYPAVTIKDWFTIICSEIFDIGKGSTKQVPTKVKKYRLDQILSSQEDLGVVTALYTTQRGKKVIGKFWSGSIKNLGYYAVIKEIKILQILERVLNLSPYSKELSFPKVLHIYSKDKTVGYIQEFIEAEKLSDLKSHTTYLEIYDRIRNIFNEITQLLTVEEKRTIGYLTIFDMLLRLPLRTLLVCKKYPQHSLRYISALLHSVVFSTHLIFDSRLSLVHGDLHGENILVKDTTAYVIDVEQMRISYPWYEIITAISTRKTPHSVSQVLYKRLLQQAKKSKLRKYYSVLLLNNSLSNFSISLHKESYKRQQLLFRTGLKLITPYR